MREKEEEERVLASRNILSNNEVVMSGMSSSEALIDLGVVMKSPNRMSPNNLLLDIEIDPIVMCKDVS